MGRKKGGRPLLKENQEILHRMKNSMFSIRAWESTGLIISSRGQGLYLSKIEARILMRRLVSIFEEHDFGPEDTRGIQMKNVGKW